MSKGLWGREDLKAIDKIEKFIFSLEYSNNNSIIDIEGLAKDCFNIDCKDYEPLEKLPRDTVFFTS